MEERGAGFDDEAEDLDHEADVPDDDPEPLPADALGEAPEWVEPERTEG